MGSVDKFEINLEHDIDEQYQYEPGEMIRGHVLLTVKEPIKIKDVTIQIKGEATGGWEDEGRGGQSYRADETYIDVTHSLLKNPGEIMELNVGDHRFNIEYILPKNLPSSFIGKFGSITYVVKSTLKEAKKFGMSTMITSEPFLVLRRLDLSRDPALAKKIEMESEKRMWGAFAFCLSGKVWAKLTVNKAGHLPGEDIFMDAEITNSSPRIVKAVQASIVMHSTFHARTKSRYNTQIVNKKRDEWEMSYGEGRRWKNVRLTIPPYIPESRLDGCDIIDIRYELIFKIEVSGGSEIKMTVPITVGTMHGEGSTNQAKIYDVPGIPDAKDRDDREEPEQEETEYMTSVENQFKDVDISHLDDFMEGNPGEFRRPLENGGIRQNPVFQN